MLKNISLRRRKKHRPSFGEEPPDLTRTRETEDAPYYPHVDSGSDGYSTYASSSMASYLPAGPVFMRYFGRKLEQAILRVTKFARTPRVLSDDKYANSAHSSFVETVASAKPEYGSPVEHAEIDEVEGELREVEIFLDKQAEQLPQSNSSAVSHIEHWISHYRDEVRRTRSALDAGFAGITPCDILRYFYKHRHAFQFAKEITTKKAFKKLEFLLKENANDEISLELLDICVDHLLDDMQNGSTDSQLLVLKYMESLLSRFSVAHSLFLQQGLRERLSPFLSYNDNGFEPEVKLLAEKVYKLISAKHEGQASGPGVLDGETTQGQEGSQTEGVENQEVRDHECTNIGDGESLISDGDESTEAGDVESTRVGDGESTKVGDDEGPMKDDRKSTKVQDKESGTNDHTSGKQVSLGINLDNDHAEEEEDNNNHRTCPQILLASITPYSILSFLLLTGFGIWKAYAVQNSTPIVGNILDWIIALVITNLYVQQIILICGELSFLSFQDAVAEGFQSAPGMSPLAFYKCFREKILEEELEGPLGLARRMEDQRSQSAYEGTLVSLLNPMSKATKL